MKLSEFLKAVAPEGNTVIGWKDEKFHNSVTSSQEDAMQFVRKKASAPVDLYFALASFKQGWHKNSKGKSVLRVRDNVNQLKALWFDIDFKGGLSDPTQVVAALREFSKRTGMPPPSILVHSGNGLHVYWPFTTPVAYETWQGMADRLKELAQNESLEADLVCTGDACRVLRVPGTRNYKDRSNPKPVYFIHDGGKRYDPAELEVAMGSAIPEVSATHDALGPVPTYAKGTAGANDTACDEWTGTHAGAAQAVESLFSTITEHCGVAKGWLDTKGRDCTEPEWTAALQLLKHCTDGALWVHPISSGHESYSDGNTDEKYEQRLQNDAGPTLCKTLEGYHPEVCAACPMFGKIKTPIVLGVEVTVATPSGKALTSWRVNPDGHGMDRKMLNPDSMQYEWVPALRRVFDEITSTKSIVSRFFDIHFKVKMSGAEDIEIILPAGHLGNDHKLKETMANFGAPLRGAELNPFKDFMGTWLEKLQKEREVAAVTEQLGWVRDSDTQIQGFSAGTTTYLVDGTQKQGVRIAKEFLAIGRMYEKTGTIPPWSRACDFITTQNNPAFTAVIASAFAAPILGFTGVQGGILSLVSPESGVGKSSALMVAQAVWGSPTHGMNSVDDTRLSVARKLGFLNNLPAYWDELRGHKVMDEFCQLAFQVSQGKEKTRLDSSATMREVNTWETMLIAASNESIFDYMGSFSVGSDAGVARTFEITVAPFDSEKSRAEIAMMFEGLKQNYGHAGQKYAKHLAVNHKQIKLQVSQAFMAVSNAGHMKPQERFWFAMIAALIVGARTANEIGLCNINVSDLGRYLLHNVARLRMRSHSSMLGSTPAELIAAYMQQHQDKGLVVDHLHRGTGQKNYEPVIVSPPKADRIVYQLAEKDSMVRISKGDFITWLKKSKDINYSTVAKKFGDELGAKLVKTSLGIGTKWQMPRQQCLDITIEFGVPSE